MTLLWVVIGTIAQIILLGFLAMLAIFAGGGYANAPRSQLKTKLLDLSMLALPGSCLVAAGIVIYLYNNGGGVHSYWWYALPLAMTLIYFKVMNRMR